MGHDPAEVVEEAEGALANSFAAAAERLPGLQGATYQAPTWNVEQTWGLVQWDNTLFTGFGLVPGEGQATDDATVVSPENIDLLNADVLFVAASGSISLDAAEEGFAALREDPRFDDPITNGLGRW